MLGEILKALVAITLAVMALRCAVLLVASLVAAAARAVGQALGFAGPIFNVILAGMIGVSLVIGVIVRLQQATQRRDPRGLRDRRAQERLVRQTVRRPAADVPLAQPTPAPDPDPILEIDDDEVEP